MITLVQKDSLRLFVDQETGEFFCNASAIANMFQVDFFELWEWITTKGIKPGVLDVLTRNGVQGCYLFTEGQVTTIFNHYYPSDGMEVDSNSMRMYMRDLISYRP